MAISTANSPKALAPGLGGQPLLQANVMRDPMQAHNSLASASRSAAAIPRMKRSNKHEAFHNCGGPAHHRDGGCAHC